ncbi:serine/threonine-protein kinase [Nocardia sp. XZ_19_385]|uniref:serine/threonine-protein kinase n=1 Tax=Nocardia sp. XZ_19_385 TaxID=2769488 RepID=UPI00188E0060|nr:serine/threonine-protein kinase [Nocardia sp. XZ_19_385]
MSLQPGAHFAGFTIERVLGTGGMGTVYLAEHPRLQRRVALKVLANSFTADQKTRAAFDREATVAAGLDHPNIVAVYDRSAAEDPALWLAMRYIDGGDAAGLLTAHPGGLEAARAVRLLTDAAHALDYAHDQGVLHRDVKPANLLVENSPRHGERAVLTDFGIARTLDDTVTLSGIAATFAYAAPERFTNAPAGRHADVYSLGCTLFQLLTGQQPFPRKDQAAVIGAHLSASPPAPSDHRPELPAELDAVIATAMAKSPQDRYPTCTALAEAAARALLPAVALEKRRPVGVSSPPAINQAAVPTVIRGAPVPRRNDPTPPLPGSAEPDDTGGSARKQRFAMLSGLLLAGVGVVVGAAFTMREDSPTTSPATSTTVVPQSVTSAPAPASAPPTADMVETHEPVASAPPPTQQYVPPVQRPANPPAGDPPVVPQTRAHQYPG